MGNQDVILRATFSISSTPFTTILHTNQLTWCPKIQSGVDDMSEWVLVKVKDLLSVDFNYNETNYSSGSCCFNANPPTIHHKLVINYAQKEDDSGNWTDKQLILEHLEPEVVNTWATTIQSLLNQMTNRPKKFLIFVNPYGGKKKANSIYDKRVRPILELSKVSWTVIHTQRTNHVTEFLLSMSDDKLREFDVVVAVGGDGTVCEVVTGLLKKNLTSDSQLCPAVMPIAVIPAGSSNALAYSLHGTGDTKTAAIFLVIGNPVPLDVGAVYNFSGLTRFIVTQMSYGHLADTLLESEKLRWMGPKRYDYAGLCKFLNHATYNGSLDIRVSPNDCKKPVEPCKGGSSCNYCNSSQTDSSEEDKAQTWKRIEGTFLGISGANISCRCVLSPNGIAPYAHISDGCLELILIRKTSHVNHLRYLLKCAGDSVSTFALPFVERYRVREFVFTPIKCCERSDTGHDLPSPDIGSSMSMSLCGCDIRQQKKNHSLWNCDGELLFQPSIRVAVHRDLIRIMAH